MTGPIIIKYFSNQLLDFSNCHGSMPLSIGEMCASLVSTILTTFFTPISTDILMILFQTQHIIHLNGRCLDYLPGIKSKMTISVCDMTSRSQQWVLDMKHWHLPAKSQTENNDT